MLERTPTSDINKLARRVLKRRRWIVIDVESRSDIDLASAGPDVYSLGPRTECRKLAIITDDGAEFVWHSGEPVLPIIHQAINEGWNFVIHNVGFDATLWAQNLHIRHGFPPLLIERCIDTMTRAAANGWPMGLGDLADARGYTHRKDRVRESANRRAMRPRKAKKNEDPSKLYYHPEPDDEYVLGDARATREAYLDKALPEHSPREKALEQLTWTVNQRGILVDIALAKAICKIGEEAARRINAKLSKITRGAVTSTAQIGRLFEFAKSLSYRGRSLDRAAVEHALKQKNLPPKLRSVLSLRLQGGGAAIKKFPALLACVSPDNRVRHWAQFWGAHTGRWTSRRVQFQNLKRLSLTPEEAETAIAAIMTGDFEHVSRLYGDDLIETLGEMGRLAIIGNLMGADLASIEARVAAWVADERWLLNVFRRYDATHAASDDVYVLEASRLLHTPPHAITEEQRRIGKICSLAFQYQGGRNAFLNFMPTGFTDDQIETFKRNWRMAHPAICRFWRLINKAAVIAVEHPSSTVDCGRLSLKFDGLSLRIRLPSGRSLSYPKASIIEGLYGPCVSFYDAGLGQFKPVRNGAGSYGGLLFENCIQSIAADVLGEGMLRLEVNNYPVVLHVHDEVVCELPEGFGSLEDFTRILVTRPRWCLDLPISASAWAARRYCK